MIRLNKLQDKINTLEEKALSRVTKNLFIAQRILEKRLSKLLLETPTEDIKRLENRLRKQLTQITENLILFKDERSTFQEIILASSNLGTQFTNEVISTFDNVSLGFSQIPIESILEVSDKAFDNLIRYEPKIKEKMIDALIQGLIKGDSKSKIIRDFRSVIDLSYYQAQRIVRTEIISAYDAGAELQMRDAGIQYVQWTASLETTGRVCPYCASRHGTIYDINNAPRVPAHPHCRCLRLPYKQSWEQKGLIKQDYQKERKELITLSGSKETNELTPFESQVRGISKLKPIKL
jgi:SPP1 gp7 family putative phage head morphogenesis protein